MGYSYNELKIIIDFKEQTANTRKLNKFIKDLGINNFTRFVDKKTYTYEIRNKEHDNDYLDLDLINLDDFAIKIFESYYNCTVEIYYLSGHTSADEFYNSYYHEANDKYFYNLFDESGFNHDLKNCFTNGDSQINKTKLKNIPKKVIQTKKMVIL